MKAAKTWCLAGLILVAGLSSASCGKDEGTDGSGGKGSVLTGGSGGSGTVGRSGSTGNGDGGAVDGPQSATKLGRACVSDKDCTDPTAPGLSCITSSDSVLANGAPPKGLCTKACTLPEVGDRDPCAALGPDGMCYPFDSASTEGYCIEGCSFGEPDIGDAKCHSRPEFACVPALLGGTGAACADVNDCPAGDLCIDGECAVVFPGCLPSCRGDLDCDAGMYCDQGFLDGTCVKAKQTGKALGEPCTVPASDNDADECIGFCQADSATGNKGHCSATCGLARQCSWNATTEKFDGVCFYGTVLTSDTGDVGDFGFCTPTCDCTDQCNDPTLACSLLTQGALSTDFRGAGLCFGADPMTKEYNQCTGSGGAGGESAGGAGGAGGDAAAPAGGVGGAN